jgi:hypothetical protein
MPSAKTPQIRLFVAQIRAGDPSALYHVEQALIRNAGNLEKTAKDLGVAPSAIYRWGDAVPAVGVLLSKHRRGRGRGPGKPKEPPPKAAKKRAKKAKAT